jgi:hypothetical protein
MSRTLNQLVEGLLNEVNEAQTKVDDSEDKQINSASAYSLFSTWTEDIEELCEFHIVSSHTPEELYDNYEHVFEIIEELLSIAQGNYDYATRGGNITGEDKTVTDGILKAIHADLNTAISRYNKSSREQFIRQFERARTLPAHAPSASLLALPHALAQLKALSAPCEGCDYNCACGACKTCVGATDVIRKKKQAGCRCRACAERSTTRTAP